MSISNIYQHISFLPNFLNQNAPAQPQGTQFFAHTSLADAGGGSKGVGTEGRTAFLPVSDAVLNTLVSFQESSGASQSSGRSSGREIQNINGYDVIVAGHSLDAREGISLLKNVNPYRGIASSPEEFRQNFLADVRGKENADNAPGLTSLGNAKAHEPLPPGASSPYVNIDGLRPAGQWVQDPLSFSTNDGGASYRQRSEKLFELIDVERALKKEHGPDAKLVYSHSDDGYILLTHDDAGYDNQAFAEDAVQDILSTVRKGFVKREVVSDLLSKYGYSI